MDLTHDDVNKILRIVDNAPHIDEIEFARSGFQLRIRRGASGASSSNRSPPAANPSIPAGAAQSATTRAGREQVHGRAEIVIRSPVAGLFRRSPALGHSSFVAVGQKVWADDTMGLVGMANTIAIKPGVEGTVKQIFPEEGELVKFDQILIVIGTDQQDRRP